MLRALGLFLVDGALTVGLGKDFLPKNGQIWPKIGIFGQFGPGHAFGALLVGRLVVVARGLYLARHLFTLYVNIILSLFWGNFTIRDTLNNIINDL